jgi:hypothetical protein
LADALRLQNGLKEGVLPPLLFNLTLVYTIMKVQGEIDMDGTHKHKTKYCPHQLS